MSPTVSICMPHLNSMPFTEERMATILAQTLTDWELIIVDSQSDDGSREILDRHVDADPRIRLIDGPRDGIYTNLNRGLEQCSGRYVYIATSDDTMALDCLAKLVAALEQHPECDLSHCPLRVIDAHGRDQKDGWSTTSTFARSSGQLLDRHHLRRAPLDGLLHLLGSTVYRSLTQLLIRRSLFARVGYFESQWGSIGDFNWDMRAALVAHTVHVPDTWGGWRRHGAQATAAVDMTSAAYASKVDSMTTHALVRSADLLAPTVRDLVSPQMVQRARDMRAFLQVFASHRSGLRRLAFLMTRALSGSWSARSYLAWRLFTRDCRRGWGPDVIRQWLERSDAGPFLVPTEKPAARSLRPPAFASLS